MTLKLQTFVFTWNLSAFVSEKLSYAHISRFSKLATDCFRPVLQNKIKEAITSNKFSFSLDSSTIAGQNICGLKVRYLEKRMENEFKEEITTLVDKIIGIQNLSDKSCVYTYLDIIQNKVFSNDQRIRENLVGVTHDRASTFTGSDHGLISLFQKEVPQAFFDLPDPCHSLNLIVKHSLEHLPENIKKFITEIHTYFGSPQRREKLKIIQKQNNLPVLFPKHDVKTRWLSLGDSLERIVQIWDSLKLYFEIVKEPKHNKNTQEIQLDQTNENSELFHIDNKSMSQLLQSNEFKVQISFLDIFHETN